MDFFSEALKYAPATISGIVVIVVAAGVLWLVRSWWEKRRSAQGEFVLRRRGPLWELERTGKREAFEVRVGDVLGPAAISILTNSANTPSAT